MLRLYLGNILLVQIKFNSLPFLFYSATALLSATLRTYQTAACESEQVTLSCPHGTGISVELVQYGNGESIFDAFCCLKLQLSANRVKLLDTCHVTQFVPASRDKTVSPRMTLLICDDEWPPMMSAKQSQLHNIFPDPPRILSPTTQLA